MLTELLDHRTAAIGAGQIRRALGTGHLVLLLFEMSGEAQKEVPDDRSQLFLPNGDLVEFLFHARREVEINDLWEVSLELLRHNLAPRRREQTPRLAPHVLAVDQGAHRRRIGRRATDPDRFHLFHEGRLGETWRRLGEVLLRRQLAQIQDITLCQLRKHPVEFFGLVITAREIDLEVALELERLSCCPEHHAVRFDVDRCRVVDGLRHLGSNGPLPDHLVELELVGVDDPGKIRRKLGDGRRSDRLVSLLCTLRLRGELPDLVELFPVLALDDPTDLAKRVVREGDRVGSHVGDMAGFVQTLSHLHGLPRRVRELGGCDLLQRRCLERGWGLAPALVLADLSHGPGTGSHPLDERRRTAFVRQLELVLLAYRVRGIELRSTLGREVGGDVPELLSHEGADLTLPLNYKEECRTLYTSRGQIGPDRPPQQW